MYQNIYNSGKEFFLTNLKRPHFLIVSISIYIYQQVSVDTSIQSSRTGNRYRILFCLYNIAKIVVSNPYSEHAICNAQWKAYNSSPATAYSLLSRNNSTCFNSQQKTNKNEPSYKTKRTTLLESRKCQRTLDPVWIEPQHLLQRLLEIPARLSQRGQCYMVLNRNIASVVAVKCI